MSDIAADLRRVAEVLAAADSIGVVGHVGPDGDALGSMIALIIFLNGLGAIALISPIVFLLKPKFIFKKKQVSALD